MSKRWKPRAVCLWPGLARLWEQGNVVGLAQAVAFALLLNVLLASSLVWTAWLSPAVQWAGWAVAIAFWLVSAIRALHWEPNQGVETQSLAAENGPAGDEETESLPQEDLFREAIAQYLQGNWYGAEDALRRQLAEQPRDVQARLMLATMLRHTDRLEEAAVELQQTARLEAAGPWRRELDAEWRLLSEAEQAAEQDEPRLQTGLEEEEQGNVSRAA